MFPAPAASKSKSAAAAGAGCWLMAANARPFGCTGATRGASIVSIEFINVEQRRVCSGGQAAPASSSPPLLPDGGVVAQAAGVVLGWRARSLLVLWLARVIFVGMAGLETRGLVVAPGR